MSRSLFLALLGCCALFAQGSNALYQRRSSRGPLFADNLLKMAEKRCPLRTKVLSRRPRSRALGNGWLISPAQICSLAKGSWDTKQPSLARQRLPNHCDHGRHRPHAGWQRRLGFPRAIKATATCSRPSQALPRKLSATYEYPFLKHAPIGPTMALADVRSDGTVHIYTHNQNPQAHPIRQFLRPVIRRVLRQRLLESHIRSKRKHAHDDRVRDLNRWSRTTGTPGRSLPEAQRPLLSEPYVLNPFGN
jgi:hypothetical protein